MSDSDTTSVTADETASPAPSGSTSDAVTAVRRRWAAVWRRVRRHPVVAAVLVVALVTGGVWFWVDHRDTGRPGQARSAASAVRGYLTAVAEGRAVDALAYLADPRVDRTFLTDEVLARSHQLAPLTDIQVKATSSGAKARFRLGGYPQVVELEVEKTDGYWFVTSHLPQASLSVGNVDSPISWFGVPVLVNGVPLPPGKASATLFPGRYEVTSTHPLVQLDSQFTATANSEVSAGRWVTKTTEVVLRPRLTDDGRRQVQEAAQAQLDTCLAQHSFATDCGFVMRLGSAGYESDGDYKNSFTYVKNDVDWPVDATTISWSGTGTALPPPDPHLTLYPGSAKAGVFVEAPVEIWLQCTWTGTAGQQSRSLSPAHFYVADVTDPDRVVVTFRSS